ncbi:conserved membrane hypothetical protein [Flavobacterium sp. 9AF]|uniref:hypothetical protein n=1 Tax=Flavobacterium sp. 9AF TaxID=2653142 RepID=UPI0012F2A113|nr:hypothetical protein [Flavobacterium sp. 9AF]VXB69340.1 conserved membrane hypothetical protein [Flavobacterium sp. 9AF]
METNFHFKELPFSTQLAITSFLIGTFLFLLYFIFSEALVIMIIGYVYLFLAVLINLITLLHLIYLLSKEENTEDLIIRILILLSNIPIAFLYAYIIINR